MNLKFLSYQEFQQERERVTKMEGSRRDKVCIGICVCLSERERIKIKIWNQLELFDCILDGNLTWMFLLVKFCLFPKRDKLIWSSHISSQTNSAFPFQLRRIIRSTTFLSDDFCRTFLLWTMCTTLNRANFATTHVFWNSNLWLATKCWISSLM